MKSNITKYLSVASVALAAAILPSCNDFLDVQPNSAFSNTEIFSSETETKAMLGTVYSKLTSSNLYGQAWPYNFNTNTDVEMKSNSVETASANGDGIHCFDQMPAWTQLENTWNNAYEAINYANDFLENIQESPLFSREVTGNPTNFQQMYGEMKCLRAMIYLDLIRTWGDVVYRTKSTSTDDDFYHEGVTDRNVILTDLINDLIEAEPYMQYASEITEGVERASREFCQALIGQLAIYRGGWSLRPGGTVGIMERESDYLDYYKIARTYLGKVISEGHHSLDKQSFADLWDSECNWSVLKDGDVIFEVPMLRDGSGSLGYNIGMTIAYDEDHPTHSYGSATNRVSYCGFYPFTFDQRDLRLDITCVPYSYDDQLNETPAIKGSCVTGWNIGKWNKMKMRSSMLGTAGNTGINSIRMRYADVLLMYAEVENEINGPTDEAKKALKAVRRRAFDPSLQTECVEEYVNALTDPSAFFEAIVSERAWEFGGEGIRKYDLARWNRYGSTVRDLYDTYADWGKRAAGLGVKGDVRDRVYYREITDPATGRITLEFKGLKEYGDGIGDHPASEGWVNVIDYASSWWVRNDEIGEMELHKDIKWSFRGHLNINNESSVSASDPVRYLCPYPARVITSHRGSIKQQYGF